MNVTPAHSTGEVLDDAIASGRLRDNPYPTYQTLRRQAPICWSERWGCWVLSRYADVSAVMQDSSRFTSAGRVVNEIRRRFTPEQAQQVRLLVEHYSRGLINSDPPDHTRQRKLVQSTFVPRVLERLRPYVQQIVGQILDRAEESGQMEIVADLAFPLPITVIAELLGIPSDMRNQFKAWSQGIIEFMATPRPTLETALRSQGALHELREYFKSACAQRRGLPREDLLSALFAATLDGQKLSEEEMLSTCVTILIGGHETTTSLITSGVWLLLSNPELWRQLADQPSSTASAIEEFLRFEPPFQRIVRIAADDVEFYGQAVRRGQTLMLLIGAANRDETVFEQPEALDIGRSPNRHLSFGYGVHFCLGAALARLEATIAIDALLRRIPEPRHPPLAVQWEDGMVRSLRQLDLRLT